MTPAQRPTSRRERRNKVFNQMLFTRGRAQEEAQQKKSFGIFIAAGETETEERQQEEQRKGKLAYRDITK